MQVFEPVAALLIGEMLERPGVNSFEPGFVFRFVRQIMDQQADVHRLIVRPPEFQIVFVLHAGFAEKSKTDFILSLTG